MMKSSQAPLPKFSSGANFSYTFSLDNPTVFACHGKPPSLQPIRRISSKGMSPPVSHPSRRLIRKALGLDTPKTIHATPLSPVVEEKTEDRSPATSSTAYSQPQDSGSLLDLDMTPTTESFGSIGGSTGRTPQTHTSSLLADLLSPTLSSGTPALNSSTDPFSPTVPTQTSASTSKEAAQLVSLANAISILCKETLSVVMKAGKIISYDCKGGISLKWQPNAVQHMEMSRPLSAAPLSFTFRSPSESVQALSISSSLFGSIPTVTKVGAGLFDTSVRISVDDMSDMSSPAGLALYEYIGGNSNKKGPFSARNSLQIDAEKADTVQLTVVIDVNRDPGAEVRVRDTKVQVSLAAITNKVAIDDITMVPDGSFDRNKRIITWLCQDFPAGDSSFITLTALIKLQAGQPSLEASFLTSAILPMMIKSQWTDLVSSSKIENAQLSNREAVNHQMKVTQIEYKIA